VLLVCLDGDQGGVGDEGTYRHTMDHGYGRRTTNKRGRLFFGSFAHACVSPV
jgi:hypothetical protein